MGEVWAGLPGSLLNLVLKEARGTLLIFSASSCLSFLSPSHCLQPLIYFPLILIHLFSLASLPICPFQCPAHSEAWPRAPLS